MARSLWLTFALAALGFWASLVPQVTFLSASTGEPTGKVLLAWPGWSVQQDLGQLTGTVGRFRLWVSARPDGDPVTVWASLLDASTSQVLRQTAFDAPPLSLRSRMVSFPSYEVPPDQRVRLQLQVAEFEHGYALFHLAAEQRENSNLAVNGVLDVAEGPLALAHVESRSGLRAALLGEPSGLLRLILAAALSVLAVATHPRVVGLLRKLKASSERLDRWRELVGSSANHKDDSSARLPDRVLDMPWYPWPVSAVPILHVLVSNPLHYDLADAIVPLVAALLLVTISVVGGRFVVGDWRRPAAATTLATVIFFAYGHVVRALGDAVDERIAFALAVVGGVGMVTVALRARGMPARGAQFANLTSVVLLAFPMTNLVGGAIVEPSRSPSANTATEVLTAHLPPMDFSRAIGRRPDIYYIILDAYGRHDNLGGFENTEFLRQLDHRGFYIATEATSNYRTSIHSIPSSLNMSYLHELGGRTPATESDLREAAQRSALASLLQDLGYIYVHLESGYIITDKSPIADLSMTFTPAGLRVSEREKSMSPSYYSEAPDNGSIFDAGFLRQLLQTTALRPIVGQHVLPGQNEPYDWWVADRALDMFSFLSRPIDVSGPKFVFAHILKPHLPATFDQYGNKVIGISEKSDFNNQHDLSVPSAYIGQLIYVNQLVLNMIDEILRNSDDDPIIVIAGDHGKAYSHDILAAFHLPHGGEGGIYPSISSVNHFRYILDYYFGLQLGLLEDKTVNQDVRNHDFR